MPENTDQKDSEQGQFSSFNTSSFTAQKMKFLLKKSLVENFIFCAVIIAWWIYSYLDVLTFSITRETKQRMNNIQHALQQLSI